MNKYISLIRICFKLGLPNIARNITYKLKLKIGVFKSLQPVSQWTPEKLYLIDDELSEGDLDFSVLGNASELESLYNGSFKLFFHQQEHRGTPPSWFFHDYQNKCQHWSDTAINHKVNEDVKLTWDISRFHWLQQFTCAYKKSGDLRFLKKINEWLQDWLEKNPVNSGVNWVCAQECSIRLISTLNAIDMLEEEKINRPFVINFTYHHCKRISPTLGYAISQDNNHCITEAAALFIGGLWLFNHSDKAEIKRNAKRYIQQGRRVLESRVPTLILADGGFALYSTNYHRSVLNTLSFIELWRKRYNEKPFSSHYNQQHLLAIRWLFLLVNPQTGDAPNFGPNDGSNPFIVQRASFRDYRPALQFAAAILLGKSLYSSTQDNDEPMNWFGIKADGIYEEFSSTKHCLFPDSGLVYVNPPAESSADFQAFIKYPNYQFRPHQSDLLHLDLWVKGKNILRDAGSYSYNCDAHIQRYFSSIGAHNTIAVGEYEPMPPLGRFILDNWAKMASVGEISINSDEVSWQGAYTIYGNTRHNRQMQLFNRQLVVTDTLTSLKETAVLRWRLAPGQWALEGNTLYGEDVDIELGCNHNFELNVTTGMESRYYHLLEQAPVIELRTAGTDVTITTTLQIKE